MVIFDISTAFLVGGAIGIRGGGQRRDLAVTAAGLGIAPAGLVFLARYPDWDWQYILDPATVPLEFPAVFVAAIVSAALAGHWLGSTKPKGLLVALGLYLLYLLWSIPRLFHVGTQAEFFAEQAPVLPTPFVLLFAVVGGAASVVLAACWVLAGRKPETKPS